MDTVKIALLAAAFALFTVACSQQPSPGAGTAPPSPAPSEPAPAAPEARMPEPSHAAMDESAVSETQVLASGTHQDHAPRHGGTFFMALDNRHHLEGLLLPPGRFLVYLYDAHTQSVSPAELQQTTGTVQWGFAEDAPQTPLAVAGEGEYLEAMPPVEVRLPIELTLRLRLPGMPPDARPELFTFPFSHYSKESIAEMTDSHPASEHAHEPTH